MHEHKIHGLLMKPLFKCFQEPCRTACVKSDENASEGALANTIVVSWRVANSRFGGWDLLASKAYRRGGHGHVRVKTMKRQNLSQNDPQKCFPQMAQQGPHTIPLPTNYMLRLTSHFLFLAKAKFIEKMNMLYVEQYISILHSFQFVSTQQYNGPTVYGLEIQRVKRR